MFDYSPFHQGLLEMSGWEVLFYALVMTHISIVTVTVYLHRCMAHRAMDMHPALAHFFRFWSWFTTATVTKEWVSIHRKHHAKCETEEDPHSPVVKGLKTVLLNGAELYKEAKTDETVSRYGKGCPDDWVENNLYSKYPTLGIFVMLAINVLIMGPIGITVWAIQMLWMPVHAAGVINGVGHAIGYRNFECPDAATNIVPWAFWIGGEELHNNHHTFPNSAKLSIKSWEFDIGWQYIKMFRALKLVKNVREGPVAHLDNQKIQLDRDAAVAAANNRYQVMAKFSRKVISATVNQEKRSAEPEFRELYKKAKKLLVLDSNLLKTKYQKQLEELIDHSDVMATVYEFKKELLAVWKKRTRSQEELFNALHDWCVEAEKTGIKVLQEFAESLKQYSTKPALA